MNGIGKGLPLGTALGILGLALGPRGSPPSTGASRRRDELIVHARRGSATRRRRRKLACESPERPL